MSIFELPIHPAADIFPMLAEDELAELARDIAENGLIHPLVIKDGLLIDGRNRREACRIAGIEPTVIELNGQDPVAYILSSNINRRHLTKSQRAMLVATIYPDPVRYKRGGDSSKLDELGLGRRISEARTVLRWAPELADAVLSGAEPLDKSYEVAQQRKIQAEVPAKRLAALRAVDPDLADKVSEEALSLDDAEGASRARRERERVNRQGFYDILEEIPKDLSIFQGEWLAALVTTCREHPEEISSSTLKTSMLSWIEILKSAIEELP